MNSLTIIGWVAGGAVIGGGVVLACVLRAARSGRKRPVCGWRHCRAAATREVLAREERRQRPEEMRN